MYLKKIDFFLIIDQSIILMAVSKTTVDVNCRSRRNHNYDLYRYIESGNLTEAKELITHIFSVGNIKKEKKDLLYHWY